MKLLFCSKIGYYNTKKCSLNTPKNCESNVYQLGRANNSGSPPIPANIFKCIPKMSSLIYNIFSLDCSVDSRGIYTETIISEEDALKLSNGKKIYTDDKSLTPYFRYEDKRGQHTVWLEDTNHQILKIKLLEEIGFKSILLTVSDISLKTIINLIHTDRYSI